MWLGATRPSRFSGGKRGKGVGRFEYFSSGGLVTEFANQTAMVDSTKGCWFFSFRFGSGDVSDSGNKLLTVTIEISKGGAQGFLIRGGFAIDDGIEAGFNKALGVSGDRFANVRELVQSLASFETAVSSRAAVGAVDLANPFVEILTGFLLIEIDVISDDRMAKVQPRIRGQNAHAIGKDVGLRGHKERDHGSRVVAVHNKVALASDCLE